MEEIFLDVSLNAEDVEQAIKTLFPELKLFQWMRWEGDYEPVRFSLDEPAHLLFGIQFENKRLEFCWRLTLYGPQEGEVERERAIARRLSVQKLTRTLVSCQLPEELYDPYYNLIYTGGICYLVDDSMFGWSGEFDELSEPAEPIKVVRLLELPDVVFDALGKPLKQKTPDLLQVRCFLL